MDQLSPQYTSSLLYNHTAVMWWYTADFRGLSEN